MNEQEEIFGRSTYFGTSMLCCVVWLSKSPDNNKCSVEGHRDACNHRYKCVAFYTVPVVGDVGGMKSIYL